MKGNIEQIIEANARWMSGPGQNADPAEYASVAASTAQLVKSLQDEKETAGGAAVESCERNYYKGSVIRDGNILELAATDILSTLTQYRIIHREVDDIFRLIKDTLSIQVISISAQNSQ